MEFIHSLADVDNQLLFAINGAHNDVLDAVVDAVSDKLIWLPLYMLLLMMVCCHLAFRIALLWVLALVVCVVLTDQMTPSVLKPLIGRLRPSNPNNPLSAFVHIVNGYRGGCNGFPSTHAANSAGFVMFWWLILRRHWPTLLLAGWSGLVCYSQADLGVHCPTDILAGIVIGLISAYGAYAFYLLLIRIRVPRRHPVPQAQVSRNWYWRIFSLQH